MDNIELGGNINLIGFKDIEPQKLVVIKKVVGNFVKRLQNHYKEDFNNIVIDLKKIHSSESEIFAKLTISNKIYNANITDFNLFFTLNKVLKKLEEQLP